MNMSVNEYNISLLYDLSTPMSQMSMKSHTEHFHEPKLQRTGAISRTMAMKAMLDTNAIDAHEGAMQNISMNLKFNGLAQYPEKWQ